MAIAFDNDSNFIPVVSGNTYRGQGGNDTYFLSDTLIASNTTSVIEDSGQNTIQLSGLSIASSTVVNNAVELTLSNGATVQILGAQDLTFEVGGNQSAGIVGSQKSFQDFVEQDLGTTVPAKGEQPTSGVQVDIGEGTDAGGGETGDGETGGDGVNDAETITEVQIGSSGQKTYEGTDADDIFTLDAEAARGLNDDTQNEITGFDLNADSLQFDLAAGNEGDYALADLDGTDGIVVKENQIDSSTVITFGPDNDGDLISLELAGVTDASQVNVAVV